MVIGKDLKIEFRYFDLGSDLAIEGWWVDAVAQGVGSSLRLLLAYILSIAGVVKLVGNVSQVSILFVSSGLRNVVLL